ncbi:MAG: T9SS type A sorting domain-containing protein, partial [Ignavibacteriae bacterium]|nr:T9SS type A sorting domain-containing protein [Ignavibacteriota bacterium]
TGESATSPSLDDGTSWYFHIRTQDNANNWSDAVHYGPFYIDGTAPNNPTTVSSSSHQVSVWSADRTIDISWSGASDGSGSGVAGYSWEWSISSTTLPDDTVDGTGESATSETIDDGISWYFHIRTKDNASYWNSDAVHYGPFYIDGTSPINGTISINNGDSATSSLIVTLTNLGADDIGGSGVYQMRFSNDNNSWSLWEPYSNARSNWDLSLFGGNTSAGQRWVYVQYSDYAQNVSSSFMDDIMVLPITYQHEVSEGWNLISVSLLVDDYRKSVLYPTAISSAFIYDRGYTARDSLQRGIGYWLKFQSDTSLSMTGTIVLKETVNVNSRWNIIGSLSLSIPVSQVIPNPPVTFLSDIFGYSNSTGYFMADSIQPGSAYWVKVSQAGQLYMQAGSVLMEPNTPMLEVAKKKKSSELSTFSLSDQEGINRLIFRDAKGRERPLNFSTTRTDLHLEQFELPPLPPAGPLDVRYETQRMLEIAEIGKTKDIAILISSAVYPLTVEWQIRDQSVTTFIVDGKEILMQGSDKTHIADHKSRIHLRLSPASTAELPKEFALHQNYPNPFNPTTRIRFALPQETKVKLKIYNILGQEITTLIDEIQQPGFKSVTWDGNGESGQPLPSGLYFYRIVVTPTNNSNSIFIETRKMILLK